QKIKQNETADDVYAFAYDSSANAFITLTRQWGGTYTSIGSDGKPILNFATDPKVEEMLNFFINLHNNNYFTLPKEWEQDYASEMFIQKKVFMTVGSIAGITYNVPKDNSFEIGVAPIPYKTEETKAVIQQGTNVMIMKNATPYEKLYAWLFIKYLTSTDVTVDWAMKSGYLPVRESGYNSERYQNFLAFTEEYQKSEELRQLAIDRWNSKPANANKTITEQDIQNEIRDLKYISMAANAAYQQRNYMFVDPAFVGSSDVRKEVELMFDKIIVGKIPPQQAIAEALAELQGILR
ncbi:MAG: extracellular solute-binding protein, partial [Bacilli bacterium]|nr:extracellular solute-binding protein [Bacilli bacterium]